MSSRVYSRREVVRGLIRKGFVKEDNDHTYLRFIRDGQKTHIKTMISHGSGGTDIPNRLLSRMATQCALTTGDFRDLLNCLLDEEEYGKRIEDLVAEHPPPWSPGQVRISR